MCSVSTVEKVVRIEKEDITVLLRQLNSSKRQSARNATFGLKEKLEI